MNRASQFSSIQQELNQTPIAPPEDEKSLLEWAMEKGHSLLATTNLSINVAFIDMDEFESELAELYTVLKTLAVAWNEMEEEELDTELLNLFVRKNADYGDAFMEYGAVGCVIRLTDKLKRLRQLVGTNKQQVHDETVQDTIKDAVNYIILTFITLRHNRLNYAVLGRPKE